MPVGRSLSLTCPPLPLPLPSPVVLSVRVNSMKNGILPRYENEKRLNGATEEVFLVFEAAKIKSHPIASESRSMKLNVGINSLH